MRDPATILVVDDNGGNRALAREILEEAGYRVVLAAAGEAGVAAFAEQRIDCVILDVRMPVIDGFAACALIRALPGGRDVPVVFMTAQRDVETFDQAVVAGGDDFISKPFRADELVARVKALLELRHLAQERNELHEHLKRQRDDLQRLQLQKEQLISFVVHDLKNPLNAIDLFAQAMLRDPDATERLRRTADRIRSEGRALLRMITNLLDLARADETGLAPTIARVELEELVEQVSASLRPRAVAAHIRITSTISAPTVLGDRELLRRVLENLLENALRYAPEESDIQIAAKAGDGGVELRVSDSGPGVPEHLRERIFERFTQLDASAIRSNHGLGLAFCKLVIETHGGRIWIEDATPGAVFCLWLDGPV